MAVVLGVPQTLMALAKIGVAGKIAAEEAANVFGEGIAEDAKTTVAVDTGETRDSIEVTEDGVVAGGAALFLEFGTVHMAAQPFLRPAADTAEQHEPEAVVKAKVIIEGAV